MADSQDSSGSGSVDRRDFFKGAALGAAGLVVGGQAVAAGTPAVAPPPVELPVASHDLSYAMPAQASGPPPARTTGQGRPASDFMVDVLKKIGFEYAAINPGSTFQGLHESFVNHGKNTAPELLTCLHEEAAVAMAHGYAKAAGKPMLVVVHGTVGLLHSSMALFQAWADRVPVVVIVGHASAVPARDRRQQLGVVVFGGVKKVALRLTDDPAALPRRRRNCGRATARLFRAHTHLRGKSHPCPVALLGSTRSPRSPTIGPQRPR